MGFKISSSGGSGGSLPDYSIRRVLYPRKWINGDDVWEISYFSSIPGYGAEDVLLETGLSEFQFVVPIEASFSFIRPDYPQWRNHGAWEIYKTDINAYIRIKSYVHYTIYVSGVLKYRIETIIMLQQ